MARWRGEKRKSEEENERGGEVVEGRETHKEVICGRDDTLCVAGACTLLQHKNTLQQCCLVVFRWEKSRNITLFITDALSVVFPEINQINQKYIYH